MPNYFFTDANGSRRGPYDEQQLQTLATQGVISSNTPLETEGGHKGIAGQIPGLKFGAPPSRSPVPNSTYTAYSPETTQIIRSASQIGQAASTSVFSWLTDFAFRDIRLHVVNLYTCRVFYVLCWVVSVIGGLQMTYYLFKLTSDVSIPFVGNFAILFGLPLVWLCVAFSIFVARLYCEFWIILYDWMVETTKAARIYIEEKSRR